VKSDSRNISFGEKRKKKKGKETLWPIETKRKVLRPLRNTLQETSAPFEKKEKS